ncbi:unnamed protein product [Ascophyllum nodosum]
MFLAGMTRPDLSNSMRELGRRATSPYLRWRGLQHVLRSLAGTLDVCLRYGRGVNEPHEHVLVSYADSDWVDDAETRRSVTGYLLLMNKSPIVWRSKLQASITLSSSEAEWTAMVQGMHHYINIRGILQEIGFPQDTPPRFCDNRSAITAATIAGFNGRTRHVDMKLKRSREYVGKELFTAQYVSTNEQRADILTK